MNVLCGKLWEENKENAKKLNRLFLKCQFLISAASCCILNHSSNQNNSSVMLVHFLKSRNTHISLKVLQTIQNLVDSSSV